MRRAGGFSLVEVLLALALFGMGAVVLSTAYANILNLFMLSREGQQRDLALAQLREQVQSIPQREDVEAGGVLEIPPYGSVSWTAIVEETRVSNLFHVNARLEVSRSADEEDRVSEFYLFRPDWSDPIDADLLRAENESKVTERSEENDRQMGTILP